MAKEYIGTKIARTAAAFGIDKVANVTAKAVGKKGGCGCKERAKKLDALHEGISNTVSSMFQKNKKR
jgi:hypothetical protein